LYNTKHISAKQRAYLSGSYSPWVRKFYLLPKIHKDPETWTIPHQVPPGRPIVSDCGSESYQIAEYLEHYLNPLSTQHPSYLKDTYDFISKIKTIHLPADALLFSLDVDALYTNIETGLGLRAVRRAFEANPDPARPDEALLTLLELGLTCNDFEFDSKIYLQTHGTAMGKRFAHSYANIYMADWEFTVLPGCPKKPLVYLRYLDDVFGVWTHSVTEFRQFVQILNQHHPSISLKDNLQPERIEFLDTEVLKIFMEGTDLGKEGLATKVFFNPLTLTPCSTGRAITRGIHTEE